MASYTAMIMHETVLGDVEWVCENCGAKLKGTQNIENRLKACPFCTAEITAFYYLYADEDEL